MGNPLAEMFQAGAKKSGVENDEKSGGFGFAGIMKIIKQNERLLADLPKKIEEIGAFHQLVAEHTAHMHRVQTAQTETLARIETGIQRLLILAEPTALQPDLVEKNMREAADDPRNQSQEPDVTMPFGRVVNRNDAGWYVADLGGRRTSVYFYNEQDANAEYASQLEKYQRETGVLKDG